MAATAPDQRIALLLGIARLGEADMQRWWRTNALSRAGQYVLGNSFPKTKIAAGLELDILSAGHRHKDLLVRPNAVHLFSDLLPFRPLALAWLAELKITHQNAFIEEFSQLDMDPLLDQLRKWTADVLATGEAVGKGLFLGQLTQDEIDDEEKQLSIVKMLSGAYLDQGGDLRPPYFDLRQ